MKGIADRALKYPCKQHDFSKILSRNADLIPIMNKLVSQAMRRNDQGGNVYKDFCDHYNHLQKKPYKFKPVYARRG